MTAARTGRCRFSKSCPLAIHASGFLSFTRNFGHQAALLAGLEHSTGDCVISMDGDLQHPPHVMPALVRHWQDGAEIVVTTRDFGRP